MDDSVKAAATEWWQTQAADFPGGLIPPGTANELANKMSELLAVEQQEAIKLAKAAGVLAGTRTPTREGASMKKDGSELTGTNKLVWENLEETGNDTVKLLEILRRAGFKSANNQTVSLARNVLRKKGYPVPYADRTKPAAGPQKIKIEKTTEEQPAQVTPAPGKPIDRIDRKIAEIKTAIAKLQGDLETLEKAKALLDF